MVQEANKSPPKVTYGRRFARVLAYLDSELKSEPTIGNLASMASFSPSHFSRQFSAHVGMGLNRYLLHARIKRAAWMLSYRRGLPVWRVASAVGYQSAESFARAFRDLVGQSPVEFSDKPDWSAFGKSMLAYREARVAGISADSKLGPVSIREFRKTAIGYIEHRGSPELLGHTLRRFIDWRKSQALHPRGSATFNFILDDPDEVLHENYRFGLGVATEAPIAINDHGVVAAIIPKGRFATVTHVGSDDLLAGVIRRLYGQWLPDSGEELRDYPLLLRRVRFYPDVQEGEAETEIYLPLRSAK